MRPPFQSPTPVNWPPFEAAELPSELKDDLAGILRPFYLATLELGRTVCRYEVLAAIGRDWAFVSKVNGTTVAPGMTTIKGCINTAVVVSLHALFDPKAVNLQAILNRVLRPQYADRFCSFHRSLKPGFDTDRERQRLLRLQRRLRNGDAGKALTRLANLRNQIVAHLDLQPEFSDGWPTGRDMAIVLAAATNIVVSLIHFIFPRRVVVPQDVRRNARLQAHALTRAIRPSNFGRLTGSALRGTFFSPGLYSPTQGRAGT